MLFLRFHRDHEDGGHDDRGGLHRDLLETGAAMDRRRMLRTAAKLGVALGAVPLIGCASDGTSITGTDTNNGNTDGTTTGGAADCVSKIPEEAPTLATAPTAQTRYGRRASCATIFARASAD
jgi:hypothetical protein